MLILTSKILETTTVPVKANPCLGVFSSCLVKTLHKARGEKQGSGRHQRWTLLSCVSKQQKTSETEIVGRCIRSADDQKTDSVVRCIRSADDQKTDSIVRCIRSADDQKDGQCCQVYQISRRPLRRTVLSGVSDQQTTRKMDSIVRCIRSADDQKTDSVVRCIRSADDKKDGQCCQVYQISRRPERQCCQVYQISRRQERWTVLSAVCGWFAAWGRDSWCVWHAPCSAKPRSLCWMRPQLPSTWRLTTSFSRPSGPNSRTAPCSPLHIGSTPSWIMTGTGEGEGRVFF